MSQPIVAMELKYCERCGGLHLRPRSEPGPYCAACARALELAEAVLAPRPLRRGRRPLASTTKPTETTRPADTTTPTNTAETGRTA